MLRKIFAALGCAAFSLTLATSDAYAVFVTEQASFQMQDPDDGPPLENIRRVDTSGGHVFTNQFTSPNGAFGVGGEIRTITATRLSEAINGELFQPLQDSRAGFEGNDLIAISAIHGSITASTGSSATATFTDGRVYIVSVAQGTFDPRNPDTWNFAAGTFVEMGLMPPDNVLPGAGQNLVFDASQINQSSVNTTTPQQAQGRFLFEEDSTAAQNALPGSGDDWMTVTTNSESSLIVENEGLLSQAGQTIEFASLAGLSGPLLSATDLDIMNAIYADMSTKAGLGPLVFATGFGPGPDSNFNPQFGPSATGDFRGELQLRNAPGLVGIIPEPTSIALFGVGLASLAFFGVVRRRGQYPSQD